jgi:hypothetical protein
VLQAASKIESTNTRFADERGFITEGYQRGRGRREGLRDYGPQDYGLQKYGVLKSAAQRRVVGSPCKARDAKHALSEIEGAAKPGEMES